MATNKTLRNCPECGGDLARSRARLEFAVNGEAVEVPGVPHLRCGECQESVLDLESATALQEQAYLMYRKRHGLLSSEEIVAIRERLGVSQAQLGRLLHLGANTVSRWETGRKVQTASLDTLLRVLRDVPGTAEYLAKRVA